MGVNQRAKVRMTDAEIDRFLHHSKGATLATNGLHSPPHLVTMWYGYRNGRLYFETKAKPQKAVNLRRDPRPSCMVETGGIYERYTGSHSEEAWLILEMMLHKRVTVRIDPVRIRSWDHLKLDLPAMPLDGSTAPLRNDP